MPRGTFGRILLGAPERKPAESLRRRPPIHQRRADPPLKILSNVVDRVSGVIRQPPSPSRRMPAAGRQRTSPRPAPEAAGCAPFSRRHRRCTISSSLNAISSPFVREPAPFVTCVGGRRRRRPVRVGRDGSQRRRRARGRAHARSGVFGVGGTEPAPPSFGRLSASRSRPRNGAPCRPVRRDPRSGRGASIRPTAWTSRCSTARACCSGSECAPGGARADRFLDPTLNP